MSNSPDLSQLGLPEQWQVADIPDLEALQAAAERALHDINAFLVLHREEPQMIAAQLERFAEILKAAIEVEGPHREKTIKLALDLEKYYWLNSGKVDAWVQLLLPMLAHTLNLDLPYLRSRLFQSWGVYVYLTQSGQKPDASKQALETAMEYAVASEHEDIRLLAEVEYLNFDSHTPERFDDVCLRAIPLLQEAHRLHYTYLEGRIYLTLASAYRSVGQFDRVFEYSQQALSILVHDQHYGLAGQALIYILPAAQSNSPYRSQLLDYLNQLLSLSGNVILQSIVHQSRACQCYKQHRYDEARLEVLKSHILDRANHYHGNYASNRHMLGLIQTELHHFTTARHHLRAALAHYLDQHDQSQIVNAEHALAYVALIEKDYSRAYQELTQVLKLAQELPASRWRDNMIRMIQDDICKAERGLNG